MSASACVVFYGLRFEVPQESVEFLLENQKDPRIEEAQKSQLDIYWANFGGADERYLLFIGKKLGILGPENAQELAVAPKELTAIMAMTESRLKLAGLLESPALFVQWEEDV